MCWLHVEHTSVFHLAQEGASICASNTNKAWLLSFCLKIKIQTEVLMFSSSTCESSWSSPEVFCQRSKIILMFQAGAFSKWCHCTTGNVLLWSCLKGTGLGGRGLWFLCSWCHPHGCEPRPALPLSFSHLRGERAGPQLRSFLPPGHKRGSVDRPQACCRS